MTYEIFAFLVIFVLPIITSSVFLISSYRSYMKDAMAEYDAQQREER